MRVYGMLDPDSTNAVAGCDCREAEQVMSGQDGDRCSACDAVLSRYNTTLLCGACSRGRRLPAADQLWLTVQGRRAIAEWDVGAVVALYLRHTGLTQGRIAKAVGIDQSEVSRLVNGRKQIRDLVQAQHWLKALGVPATLLPATPTTEQTADLASDLTQLLETSGAEDSISRLEQAAERMGSYPGLAPSSLWSATNEDLRLARNLLAGRLSLREHEAVLRAVAILAGTSAHLLMDMADWPDADRHLALCLRAGEQLDDPDLYAWCLGMAAVDAGVRRDWTTAAEHLDNSEALPLRPGRRAAWLAAQHARAYAGLGEPSAALRSLDHAWKQLGRADEPTSTDFFDEARLAGMAGTVQLMLNRPDDARNTITEAIEQRRSDDVKGIALLMLDNAECYIQQSAPDAAAHQVRVAEQLARQQLVAPIRTRMRRLRRQMEPWADTVAVKQLDVELHNILTGPGRYEYAMDGPWQS